MITKRLEGLTLIRTERDLIDLWKRKVVVLRILIEKGLDHSSELCTLTEIQTIERCLNELEMLQDSYLTDLEVGVK